MSVSRGGEMSKDVMEIHGAEMPIQCDECRRWCFDAYVAEDGEWCYCLECAPPAEDV